MDKSSGAYSMHRRDKNIHTALYSQKLKGRVYLEDLGIVRKQYKN
jgi:hypothetical protein